MEDRLEIMENKIDEIIDDVNKVNELFSGVDEMIEEQRVIQDESREILSGIDYLYKRINESDKIYIDGVEL